MHSMTGQYLGELRTEVTHLRSGISILTDAPPDNQGKGEAFSPTDLTCASLNSCMMTLMGIVARRENIPLQGLTSKITKVMAANPRRIIAIEIVFHHPQLQITAEQRALLTQAALSCPVALSLHPDINQKVTFDF